MLLRELDYELPAERIAQRPLQERDASRMMLLERASGTWEDRAFREFPSLLRGDELLVVNNARVIPARLLGRRAGVRSGPQAHSGKARKEFLQSPIEVLLLRRLGDESWEALVRPGRKVGISEKIVFGDGGELEAEVEWRGEFGLRRLRLHAQGDVIEAIERLGHVPLPPYIRRSDDPADRERYQTIFASHSGAVAAPTAGLHFTPAILEEVRARGIQIVEITLEVGLGTFEPIRSERLEEHHIHREVYEIPEATAEAINHAKRERRPILAIGTTVVRALEDAAEKSLGRNATEPMLVNSGRAEAEIFLYPGKVFTSRRSTAHEFSPAALKSTGDGCGICREREHILRAYAHAV